MMFFQTIRKLIIICMLYLVVEKIFIKIFIRVLIAFKIQENILLSIWSL